MRPILSHVTLCAADSAYVGLTAAALERSLAECDFADAILFTHAPVQGPFRTVAIPPLRSVEDYSRFCLTGMVSHIQTRFVLVIQWDGFVVDGTAWHRDFMKYDYVGAPWHGIAAEGRMVGNGGFSLRSRKLLQALQQLPFVPTHYLEDQVICNIYRDVLERDFRIRFAPVALADRFSYEFHTPEEPTFGFHGIRHLWKHWSDDAFRTLVGKFDLDRMSTDRLLQLAVDASAAGRATTAGAVYAAIRGKYPAVRVAMALAERYGSEDSATMLDRLEGLLAA